jgi:hypothetical protein
MDIKKLSFRTVIPTLLALMAILPLSGCNNNSTRSPSSSDAVKTATSNNLDRFLFRRNGKLGYIDRTGKIVIPARFDRLGYIDKTGKLVFKF